MEIFNNYYAKKQFQKDVHCAKKILMTFQYFKFSFTKGQLISKCPFGVIVSTKITTKKFANFCPRNLKRGQIIREGTL